MKIECLEQTCAGQTYTQLLSEPKKAFISILQSYLQEWDPQEHACVSPELRPEWPQGVSLNLFDKFNLVHEEDDPDIKANIVNSFPFPIHNHTSGFRFFLFLKQGINAMWF